MKKNYSEYYKRADKIAKDIFKQVTDAEREHSEARKALEAELKQKYYAEDWKSERRRIDCRERVSKAEKKLRETQRFMREDSRREIENVRAELAEALDKDYAAHPEEVDSQVMTLIASGIMKPRDYEKIMEAAKTADNYTMIRLIGKSAGDAAKSFIGNHGVNEESEDYKTLLRIENEATHNPANDVLSVFDTISDVFSRSAENPGMISKWEELTGELVNGGGDQENDE